MFCFFGNYGLRDDFDQNSKPFQVLGKAAANKNHRPTHLQREQDKEIQRQKEEDDDIVIVTSEPAAVKRKREDETGKSAADLAHSREAERKKRKTDPDQDRSDQDLIVLD